MILDELDRRLCNREKEEEVVVVLLLPPSNEESDDDNNDDESADGRGFNLTSLHFLMTT
jgi:hypothetical protein